MYNGERLIGAAKGKQTNTMASCHPPPPSQPSICCVFAQGPDGHPWLLRYPPSFALGRRCETGPPPPWPEHPPHLQGLPVCACTTRPGGAARGAWAQD